ncbi:MAG: hypothetical protein WBC38_02950 [Microgenomates group bacterium]
MIYIFLASILYTVGIMFGAAASRSANTNLVAGIMNAVSALLPIALVIPILNAKTFTNSKMGIIYAVVAGLLIALFTMALGKSFAENKVAIVSPMVFGGAIFLSTILGYVICKEQVSRFQAIGLFFLAVGLGFVIYARWTGR